MPCIACWTFCSSAFVKARLVYAAFFFPALTFAHRALCAAAIFLRADADMVRFT